MENELLFHWQKLFEKYNTDVAFIRETGIMLINRYNESHRKYHNLYHIRDMLNTIDRESKHLKKPALLLLATWFHDAIYSPENTDNETKSAELAAEVLENSSLAPKEITYISSLIKATAKHNWQDKNMDTAIFLDTDLSILGASNANYDIYAHHIRMEYKQFADEVYSQGRTKVLKSFLQKKYIFNTALFREKFEQKARLNISREILKYTS
ncbi:MAG: hypothetical protein AAGI07_13660 [Bacteroidota bacterium]